MAAIDASLKQLGTDYGDLLKMNRFDHNAPIGATLEAMHDDVKTGKRATLAPARGDQHSKA